MRSPKMSFNKLIVWLAICLELYARALLLEPKVVRTNIIKFWHEKVVNHGSIAPLTVKFGPHHF